ncbi:exodeoxyribonuclease VII small subunit [Alienimonas californiensis]|uniref:Exodeoxyribonuclease 7 small subunit n=1 Tax=Alienimonas californiensis TaxID=2527989 RepID=A0A517PEA8_9PLAN|nr:exodeoxyribonuclease VII small subunit [Alienimonas californiensis]QDT17698.1 Exodeoxyribonuclease 7 small subunit [Alienimonas californiensis]
MTENAHAGRDEPPFEEALDDLRAVIADLEGGRLGLEESLARFEAGVGLLRRCRATLERAERRVELLTGVDADGEPVTEPFDASATAEQAGAGRRDAGTAKSPRNRRRAADEDEPDGLF